MGGGTLTKQSKACQCQSALSRDTTLSLLCTGTQGKQALLSSPTLSSSAPDFCVVDAGLKLVCILISGAVWAAQFIL